jgi:arabinofuranosyltransferase
VTDRTKRACAALAAGLATAVLCVAVARAWVADDAYITFRYIQQFLAGNGLVFNAGERVEGYTNPLWLFWLIPFAAAGLQPPTVALVTSLVLAALLLASMIRDEWRATDGPAVSAGLALLVGCSGFTDFATSGLETMATMFFVHVAFRRPALDAPVTTGLALSLAHLCHPDVALLAAGPVAAAALDPRARSAPGRALAFLAALAGPALAHLAFRRIYFDDWLPNTYYAKVGGPYWSQGGAYLADFVVQAPLTAPALALGFLIAWRGRSSDHASAATVRIGTTLAAVALHAASIARLGGDFMGFRLLLPDLAAVATVLVLPWRFSPARTLVAQSLACGAALASTVYVPPKERGLIVNERLNYAYAFRTPLDAFRGVPDHLWWRSGVRFARLQRCIGEPRLSIEQGNLGYSSYAAGVTPRIVDGIGLVDREIARAWTPHLRANRGRPGHEGKIGLHDRLRIGFHLSVSPYDKYNRAMGTTAGVFMTLDPRVVCAVPGLADSLRDLKLELSASADSWDRLTLEMIQTLERRDGVATESLCRAGGYRDCRMALRINRPEPTFD